MNKPYELTDKQLADVSSHTLIGKGSIAHAAQKKLLKYLESELLLVHDWRLLKTHTDHMKDCRVCSLLKDFGIKK